jgi:tetratricopeptide (TPR) repeat protein
VLEDLNVEHLLDVFTSIDTGAVNVWDACGNFLHHLYWHKPRQTTLGTKIEGLPDGHPSEARCLLKLAQLSGAMGNNAEYKCLLLHTLTLERERGNYFRIAETLQCLSYANQRLGMYEEGIQQAEEAMEIFKQLGDVRGQSNCLQRLAGLFFLDSRLDAAEDTVSRKIELLPEKGQEFHLCQSHRLLGKIYRRKGEKEKAVYHFKTALTIASPFNWQGQLFWIHYDMAALFFYEGEFDDANAHIEQAKSHVAHHAYNLGLGMEMQAWIWYRQHRLDDARSEALGAIKIYEKLGLVQDMVGCRNLLQWIEEAMESCLISNESDPDGEHFGHNSIFYPC